MHLSHIPKVASPKSSGGKLLAERPYAVPPAGRPSGRKRPEEAAPTFFFRYSRNAKVAEVATLSHFLK